MRYDSKFKNRRGFMTKKQGRELDLVISNGVISWIHTRRNNEYRTFPPRTYSPNISPPRQFL